MPWLVLPITVVLSACVSRKAVFPLVVIPGHVLGDSIATVPVLLAGEKAEALIALIFKMARPEFHYFQCFWSTSEKLRRRG